MMKERKINMTNTIKKLLCIICALTLIFAFAGCGKDNADTTKNNSNAENEQLLSGKHHAEITVKNMGVIKLELDADAAPITVTNFVNLSKDGFYDGLTFHRVIHGFMIQGGDPEGNGTGGSDKNIKGEFENNGFENNILHTRGVISMARSGSAYEQYLSMGYKFSDLPAEAQNDIKRAYNSASSQFFIMHQDSSHLDKNYAAFGRVTEGMDIVDKIAEETPVVDDNGTVRSGSKPIIESIKVID